jgi:hypothetical protein
VAVLVDHFSRKSIASAVFRDWPSSRDSTDWLDIIIQSIGHKPNYIITDRGPQFGEDYEDWCNARDIKPRFGAVGQQIEGSKTSQIRHQKSLD